MARIGWFSLAIALANGASAQSPARPAFEVASIRIYPPGSPFPAGGANGFKVSPDGVTARFTKLWACLEWAYDAPGRVFGPDWIRSERYDITAKAAGPVPEAQLKLMVQSLLEDRFQLKLHLEMREMPVAVLIAMKNGPRNLREADVHNPPEHRPVEGKLVLRSYSMSRLATFLSNWPPYGVNEKVLDLTGIAGAFDFDLDVQGFDMNDPAYARNPEELLAAFFPFFSAALEKQYGLKLEHRKVPLESIVIDQGNKLPVAN
jgi:uncharacterized protein (TIGR03435 family)